MAACLTALGTRALASCTDDCRNEYLSALQDCRTEYEQGGEDLQDLEDCIADGKDEYDDCVDDCTSTGAGGVVACASGSATLMLAAGHAALCRSPADAAAAPHSCGADAKSPKGVKPRRRAERRTRTISKRT